MARTGIRLAAWMRVLLVLAAAVASARVTMDTLAAVPEGWEELRRASPDEAVFLRVALKQQRGRALDQAVIDMSTPGHPSYGMHLTRDEVRSYTAPSEAAISAVTRWLDQHGVRPVVSHDWISFTTTARTANRLLETDFRWYQESQGGSPRLRVLSYSVPDQVAAHIDLVQPTTRFGHLGDRKSTIFETHSLELSGALASSAKEGLAPCDNTVTPACLRRLYNISYTPSADPSSSKVAFAAFLEQYARYDDLRLFRDIYVPDAAGGNFTVELVNGGLNNQTSKEDSTEANLDAQYLNAISHPIPMVEYSVGGRGPLIPTANQPTAPGSNEPYLEWLLYLAGLPDSALPQTISISYGEEEQSVPRQYAIKVCDMFRDLGARGVSVLFASGDLGPGRACVRNSDNTTSATTYFEPTFPASCPWVTAVGGTTMTTTTAIGSANEEKAAPFSGGGFSMYHARPSWQRDAVEAYLLANINNSSDGAARDAEYAPYFDRSGRGFPDVSALATRFAIVDKGGTLLVSGTSAACPVVAGMVALLNAARRAQGRPPLGFLNPWLYSSGARAAFRDVTAGAGVGCRRRPEFGAAGARWNATPGWDPVTGLGTPVFDVLLELAAPGTLNS